MEGRANVPEKVFEKLAIMIFAAAYVYASGRILARYECPAHTFLFPDRGEHTVSNDDQLREVEMNKCRNYQVITIFRVLVVCFYGVWLEIFTGI